MNPAFDKITVHIDAELEELIPGFLEGRKKDIDTLQEALEKEDYPAIQLLGHTLKGNGAGYGFDGISDIGRALEMAAKDQDMVALIKQTEALSIYLQSIKIVYD